jgi:hypothetical protein
MTMIESIEACLRSRAPFKVMFSKRYVFELSYISYFFALVLCRILLGAHKLRARRTVCKSVFFSKDINC